MRAIAWFSCGGASAVAASMALKKYGKDCVVVYCDTMNSEHPDNHRFFREVQDWLGVIVKVVRSRVYTSVDDVFRRTRYMSGPAGARCTVEMKKVPRFNFQLPDDIHIFGYTVEEPTRMERFHKANPELRTDWILLRVGRDLD